MSEQTLLVRPFEREGRMYLILVEGERINPKILECLDAIFQNRFSLQRFIKESRKNVIKYCPVSMPQELRGQLADRLTELDALGNFIETSFSRYNSCSSEDRTKISWEFYNLIKIDFQSCPLELIENFEYITTVSTHFKYSVESSSPQKDLFDIYDHIGAFKLIEDFIFIVGGLCDEEIAMNIEESHSEDNTEEQDVHNNSSEPARDFGNNRWMANLQPGKYCVVCKDGNSIFIYLESFNVDTGYLFGTRSGGQPFNLDVNDINEIYSIAPVSSAVS